MRPELLRRRNELLARVLRAELRIGNVAAVAIRKAEILRHRSDVVELVGRRVVAQHVATVVGEPEVLGARIPVEAH